MKKTIILLAMAVISLSSMAQMGAMQFGGPSRFGVAAMNAWQDNQYDVITFQMTGNGEADITLPAMTYNAMHLTIPSFTIHKLKFNFDAESHNAVFADQTFSETVSIDGIEKAYTGISFTATYNHTERTFTLNTTFKYGN